MKESSIEQKAKAYDKAKYIMKEYLESGNAGVIAENTIKKAFPELAEPEDERIRKRLVEYFEGYYDGFATDRNHVNVHWEGLEVKEVLAWLEKQGEHANFCNKIQIGDKVTRNEDGVLVNLSQLKRVAKKDEKQCEQKPADETPYPETLEKAIELYYYSYGNGEGGFEHLSLEKFRDIVHTFVSDYGQNSAWSEEDKDFMCDTLSNLTELKDRYGEEYGNVGKCIDWLKSLRPQKQWKPSKEQMEQLCWVAEQNKDNIIGKELMTLYKDLKKLMEE